jgi:alpha-L-arabinofuranosidase
MGTAWIDCDRLTSCLSATGLLFRLYDRHFGRIPVAVGGDSPVPPPAYPIGGDQPRVNTGSDTWPLDVSAALTADRRFLTVAVVNATDEGRALSLSIRGARVAGAGRSWKLKSTGLGAMNRAGKSPELAIAEGEFDAGAPALTIAAYGIELYEFRLD